MEETTVFITKLAAPYLLVTGIGFLLSTDFYDKMQRSPERADPIALNLSGAAHFLVGLAVLNSHFRFASPPQLLVTLIGIAATLKGAMLIAVPQLAMKLPKTGKNSLRMAAVAFIAIGAYLGYAGYF